MTRASTLTIRDLQFRRGSRVVLDAIDLQLQSGSITAVHGAASVIIRPVT